MAVEPVVVHDFFLTSFTYFFTADFAAALAIILPGFVLRAVRRIFSFDFVFIFKPFSLENNLTHTIVIKLFFDLFEICSRCFCNFLPLDAQ